MSDSKPRGPLQVARRARLLEALQRHGVLRISELTDTLGAAAVTIRRDIAQLAAEGVVRRVHGGVALIPPESTPAATDDTAPASVARRGTGLASATGRGTELMGATRRGTELMGATRRGTVPLSDISLGMLVPSLDYYWPEVARGAEEAARELEMRLVLRGSSYETEDDQPQLTRLVDQLNVDGLIVAPRMDAPTTGRTIEWLASVGIPVVLLERTAAAGPRQPVLESVVSDHALGAAMAVHHLVSLGHRRIGAVLTEHSPSRPHVHRGWLDAEAEYGLDAEAAIDAVVPDARSPESDAAIESVLDQCLATQTTALLVHADAEAIALVQHCEKRDLSVPGDLSVVAYDDEVAGLFTPPLTAIHPPRRSIGHAAVRLVAERLADPGRPAHRVVISPSLRLRGSSGPPRTKK